MLRQRLWIPLKHSIRDLLVFFPVHLFLHTLKKEHGLLLFWALLWALVSGTMGRSLGLPYLFLAPEYLNEVQPGGFFVLGLAFGGFTVAYHITCYILMGYRYTFLGRTRFPLLRFAVNNSLLPLLFLLYYLLKLFVFQLSYEDSGYLSALLRVAAFLAGMGVIAALTSGYFRLTRHRFFTALARSLDSRLRRGRLQRGRIMQRIREVRHERPVVHSFYRFPHHVHPTSNNYPYSRTELTRFFDRTQLNALIIQVFILFSLWGLAQLREYPLFQIPAAASLLILLSVALMAAGALSYWFREWAFSLALALGVLLIGVPFPINEDPYHKAFGMSYDTRAAYTVAHLRRLSNEPRFRADHAQGRRVLQRWRARFPEDQKPTLLLITTSGGGMRSMFWTYRSLQYADSLLGGSLMPQTMLITGSSGGLIGAAYFRERYRYDQKHQQQTRFSDEVLRRLGNDKLNTTALSLVLSDALFRTNTFTINGQVYGKDRGYALEQQLLADTDSLLARPLCAYREPEQKARIPMLLIAPTILNDGRKLYISPLPVSYFNTTQPRLSPDRVRGIELRRFFHHQNADSLRLITALRMSASFPYITPNVILPSQPPMSVMDAGLSDNFGVSDALHFVYVFRDWIQQHTRGVLLLSLRDTPVEGEITAEEPLPFIAPITGLTRNLFHLQDRQNYRLQQQAASWLKVPLKQLTLSYQPRPDNKASLSWRLTRREKENIRQAIYSQANQQVFRQLKASLQNKADSL